MKINFKVLAISLLFMLTTNHVFAKTFSDLEGHWAENVVEEMSEMGVLNGYEDGTFRPNASISREEFAKILVESLSISESNTTIKFEDIGENRWSKQYIDRANKYLTGYTQGEKYYFRPNEPAVREDVAVAVVQAKGLQNETPDYNLLNQFSDTNKMSKNLKKYIAIAVKNGIMQGKGGYFDPQGNLTRAEVSQLMFNIYEKFAINDITNVEKLDESKEYIYTSVNIPLGEKDSIVLPKVNINSEDAKRVNTELEELYMILKEEKEKYGGNSLLYFKFRNEDHLVYNVGYEFNENSRLISLLLYFDYEAGCDRQYFPYNFDKQTGKLLTNTEFLNLINIDENEFMSNYEKYYKEIIAKTLLNLNEYKNFDEYYEYNKQGFDRLCKIKDINEAILYLAENETIGLQVIMPTIAGGGSMLIEGEINI